MNVCKIELKPGEMVVIPPGFLIASCCVTKEIVAGTKLPFLPVGQTHINRLKALSEMATDTPGTEKVLKATLDAMSLVTLP